jgi:hypothetical protein
MRQAALHGYIASLFHFPQLVRSTQLLHFLDVDLHQDGWQGMEKIIRVLSLELKPEPHALDCRRAHANNKERNGQELDTTEAKGVAEEVEEWAVVGEASRVGGRVGGRVGRHPRKTADSPRAPSRSPSRTSCNGGQSKKQSRGAMPLAGPHVRQWKRDEAGNDEESEDETSTSTSTSTSTNTMNPGHRIPSDL